MANQSAIWVLTTPGTEIYVDAESHVVHSEVAGSAALLVNPENVFEIAKGIREVLTNVTLRSALIQQGHQQARRFSWEATAREVLEIYREVGEGRPASGLRSQT